MRPDYVSGFTIAIDDPSQVGEARRSASGVAAAVGLNATDAGKLALMVTEAASNIAKHAGRGEMMIRATGVPGAQGVEMVAIDRGPGINDLDRALRDGYSTAGSSGAGLGALARLATRFDIYTAEGAGTVIAARVGGERTVRRDGLDIGVVRVAKRGETQCGDDWGLFVAADGRALLAVADGLGHGNPASEASRRAIDIASEHTGDGAGMVVAHIHAGLRSTRGAALAVAEMSADGRRIGYAGLGNISATIVSASESRSLVSHNGIAGHEMRKIQEFSYDWPANSLLVMHSDGVSARWDVGKYPGLVHRDPSIVAGVIYRDFSRGRDDALVVVVRSAA